MQKITVKITSKDFHNLINSGQLKVSSEDLKFIKSQMITKPKLIDNRIVLTKNHLLNKLKSNSDNFLLNLELC
jgi:hypothetical protein